MLALDELFCNFVALNMRLNSGINHEGYVAYIFFQGPFKKAFTKNLLKFV